MDSFESHYDLSFKETAHKNKTLYTKELTDLLVAHLLTPGFPNLDYSGLKLIGNNQFDSSSDFELVKLSSTMKGSFCVSKDIPV